MKILTYVFAVIIALTFTLSAQDAPKKEKKMTKKEVVAKDSVKAVKKAVKKVKKVKKEDKKEVK